MRGFFLTALLFCTIGGAASANTDAAPVSVDGAACRQAITRAEQAHAVPPKLLAAIGRVESGRRDSQGNVLPWPWTINAEGQGSFFDTKAQAIAAVRALQGRGVRSIDVGCMQVNLVHHPDAFANLDQAFDPAANADYAASFLRRLYAQTNDWAEAAGQYHSATPALSMEYRRKVMAAWEDSPPSALASAWSATLGTPFGVVRPGNLPLPHVIVPASFAPSSGEAGPRGRGLDSYRAMPIAIVAAPRIHGG